jgi:methyl-accepting chemotaxis protein
MERVHEGVRRIQAASAQQDTGNEVVLASSAALREVAREVQAAIGEQSEVAARIGGGVESVRHSVRQIEAALREQAEACHRAVELLRASRAHTSAHERSVQGTEEAARDLAREAEALRSQIRRFRI